MDEEEVASTSSSSKPPSKKKRRMRKNSLKTVSLAELQDTPEPSPPDGKEGRRRLWRHEDIETFQVPDSSFNLPDAVKTPFQYFKMLFTDEMITHISEQTSLYAAQELGDPISTSPEEIEKFLAMLLFMGVFSFPAIDDYWCIESRFSVIADIMPRRRFKLLRQYLHFNDNQLCNGSPDRFYKIRPLFDMLRQLSSDLIHLPAQCGLGHGGV